jgi:spermidine synthase
VGLPSLLAGMSFPLANAVVQRVDEAVGRRAGILYFANTVGAVAGSLLAGYLLLPRLGLQLSTAVLACASVGSMLALFGASRSRQSLGIAGVLSAAALVVWFTLPSDFVLRRAIVPQAQGEQLVAVSEGATELIEVVEAPGQGRGLLTNGHAMSSTAPLDQRYMRALAHIPLLSMVNPQRVLVIGFGVGNSTHAATLHPSVTQVDVADLSRHVLDQAPYFRDANHDVLKDPRVSVFVNDGRQHLQMMPPASYDLITLEPPPIAHAGVAALYSTEFYRLARSRLKPGGYVSQWLPAYQVPSASSLAMVRAFVDVFPKAVLLSGMQAELLLLGTTADQIDIDPVRLARSLQQDTAVRADLSRLDLGTPREIVGTFAGSATTLINATRQSPAVTDDRPLQEYGVLSNLSTNRLGVPASLFDLGAVAAWCPRCFTGDQTAPEVAGLDVYLGLMEQAYATPPAEVEANARTNRSRTVMGSSYLGAALPDTPAVRDLLQTGYRAQYADGEALLEARKFPEAVAAFRAALLLTPDSAAAHNNLGVSLASMGEVGEAAEQFRAAVALQPDFAQARRNLAQAGAR